MDFAHELSALVKRDLATLAAHVQAFPSDELLWQTVPAVTNSVGNLVLHLEGNLREYIGRQLGGIAYARDREQEFKKNGLGRDELLRRIEDLGEKIPAVIASLPPEQLAMPYPEAVLERELTVHGMLVHLYGHLGWHMGQIDSLRRVLTEGEAVKRASLSRTRSS
jgi:uncharacterized damage-inducible protein DinB